MLLRALVGTVATIMAANLLSAIFYDSYSAWRHQPTQATTKGSRVLVTGASRGIGRSLALMYCGLGAKVALHGRQLNLLSELATECRRLGAAKATAVVADMSKSGAAASAVAKAARDLDGLDTVVVNHVSPFVFETQYGLLGRIAEGKVQQAMFTDLLSYAETGGAAVPHLQRSKGSLVFVSTLAAKLPLPYCYAYCYAKRALNGHVIALRQELAMNRSSVHVGVAHLGSIDTKSARDLLKNMYTDQVEFASVDDTARGIGAVAAGKLEELVIPGKLKPVLLFYQLAPTLFTDHLRGLTVVRQ